MAAEYENFEEGSMMNRQAEAERGDGGVIGLKPELEMPDGNILSKEKMVQAAKQMLQPEFQAVLQAMLKHMPHNKDYLVRLLDFCEEYRTSKLLIYSVLLFVFF